MACGTRAVNSLADVLSDPGSHLSYGDSRLGWWMLGGHPFDLASTLAVDDPESVRSLVERVRRSGTWSEGADRPALDTGRFCAVTVRGSAARIMVRDWIDMPLEQLEANVAAWFADHAMDSGNPDRVPVLPVGGCWSSALAGGYRTGTGPAGGTPTSAPGTPAARRTPAGSCSAPPCCGHRCRHRCSRIS